MKPRIDPEVFFVIAVCAISLAVILGMAASNVFNAAFGN